MHRRAGTAKRIRKTGEISMDAKMREQLLKIIETNALLGTEDLAVMLGTDEAVVQDTS